MILIALLAFSFTPLNHGPRLPARAAPQDRPFFVGEMHHLVPQERLPFSPLETATPVVDNAQTRLYAGTRDSSRMTGNFHDLERCLAHTVTTPFRSSPESL